MLKSQTFIFKYNSREVSVKVKDGKFHFVYVRFKNPEFQFSARFLLISSDYPTYESIKGFADRLIHIDKDMYEEYCNTHKGYPLYIES